MDRVHVEPELAPDPALRSAEVEWHDADVAVGRPYWYRIAAMDDAENFSRASEPVQASALRLTPPAPPTWVSAAWRADDSAVDLQWAAAEADLESLLQRRAGLSGRWKTITPWFGSIVDTFSDADADPGVDNYYRIKVRDSAGNINADYLPRFVPATTG